MKKTKKLVYLALMVSQSLVLYLVEAMLPPLAFIAPGAKLGLSNIITLSLLYLSGWMDALIVLLLRIFIASIFGGGVSALIYSLFGGLMSLFCMNLAKKLHRWDVSIIGVSVCGALSFNFGQLLAASIIISNLKIFVYLPVLSYVSVGTGIFVGLVSKFLVEKMPKRYLGFRMGEQDEGNGY